MRLVEQASKNYCNYKMKSKRIYQLFAYPVVVFFVKMTVSGAAAAVANELEDLLSNPLPQSLRNNEDTSLIPRPRILQSVSMALRKVETGE